MTWIWPEDRESSIKYPELVKHLKTCVHVTTKKRSYFQFLSDWQKWQIRDDPIMIPPLYAHVGVAIGPDLTQN